ncbi:SusC/RagA family TonB-linked outer membrane protein [Mucilaginibacter sp. JRF]|uniref:SusC/RagA family TonB-linked outer membrane protein n=1 Tax=Mucilaginibacter sp. JRF TaxID=2780088 RepID=UPI00187F0885|nr:SusC/RagA family TonB-linked outer membrane protein [Mucilaginibacter sp. JRF]MBE9586490.1 SusC/RagA family TonB-linked outer membrane protein [Mucilaginibacter sp. JRF]
MKKLLLVSLCFLLLCVTQTFAQNRTITGTVTAKEDGLPIPGVSVLVKGTSIGTQTSGDGKFTLNVPASGNTLVFSFIGYGTIEHAVPSSGSLNVSLSSDVNQLNEVVVTAGGVAIKNREQGNQSTTIRSEQLTQGKAFNVASALTGKVAGLQVNAVSSGVNPNIRLVLRGNRSLLGNNQALVVVDNVIVPTSILGNLNPEDIENIQVLNGAGAAALYGSDASNGALIITTKKGKRGSTAVTFSNTTQIEEVNFLPKIQKEYGSGTGNDDVPSYTPYENQQYGPRFDGSMRIIGKPLVDGSIQTVQYSPRNDKDKFWDNGITNQSDFSISSGDDKSTTYLSGQYFTQKATIPGDTYNRFTVRLNGQRNLLDNLTFDYTANYIQNRYNTSSAISSVFDNVLQTPSQIPLLQYSDWQTDPFANPNGYYNEYYQNPYFALDNNRSLTRNDYLTGNIQLKWFPIKELSFLFRVGISTSNQSNKSYSNKFTYSDYRLGLTSNFNNILGSVSDGASYNTQLNPEFQAQYIKQISKDFNLNVILGSSVRDNHYKGLSANINGLIVPDLFNLGNNLNNQNAGESNFHARQIGVYADARLGFRDYLYLHVSGRNDWRSVLAPSNQSFFYPAADLSFIASDAIPFLKESKTIESLKLRVGVSKVGQVNLGNASNFGAYALLPTFFQGNGYPFNGNPSLSVGNQIVSLNINPEITKSVEAGFDIDMFKSRLSLSGTYYRSSTTDQTVPVGVSNATGYSTYLTNTGEVTNEGIETTFRVVPYRAKDFEVSVGANYTYNNNKVVSISNDLRILSIGTYSAAGVYAEEGKSFPLLKAIDYIRDDQGRIVVDRITGMPQVGTNLVDVGNTEPKHRLGLDAAISYKGFRLAGLFEYRGSFFMYNSAGSFDFSGSGIRTTYFNRERFVVPNSSYLDEATGQYVANNNITTRSGGTAFWTEGPTNTSVGTNYVYSAAFWKLRELSLGYDLPKSLLGKTKYIKGARISIQGRNLFLWTPKTNIYTDPEYSAAGSDSNAIGLTSLGQTPPSRLYGATLSITL